MAQATREDDWARAEYVAGWWGGMLLGVLIGIAMTAALVAAW